MISKAPAIGAAIVGIVLLIIGGLMLGGIVGASVVCPASANGCSGTLSASFTYGETAPATLTITDSSSFFDLGANAPPASAMTHTLNWGDGSVVQSISIGGVYTHTFTTGSGTYEVVDHIAETVSGVVYSDNAYQNFTLPFGSAAPAATCGPQSPSGIPCSTAVAQFSVYTVSGLTVDVTDHTAPTSGGTVTSVGWKFGDSSGTYYGSNITHTYPIAGAYTIKEIVNVTASQNSPTTYQVTTSMNYTVTSASGVGPIHTTPIPAYSALHFNWIVGLVFGLGVGFLVAALLYNYRRFGWGTVALFVFAGIGALAGVL